MAQFIIRPAGDSDWANAQFLSGTPPMTAVDAAALGIQMGVDYEIGRLGELATFQVTNVPAAMEAPTLTAQIGSIGVTLPADPADGGAAITSRDLRFRPEGGSWTEALGIDSPFTVPDLADNTTVEVQVRAVNGNGPAPWSPSSSATTLAPAGGDTIAPVVNAISYADNILTVDLTEASGAATAVWATADPTADPTFTAGGGWSGTVYETGSFSVTDGGTSSTINLTTATPAGARELSLYFYDADGNLSAVERLTVTIPDRVAPTLSDLSAGQAGASTVAWSVTSDEAGGAIYVAAYPADGTAPTADQLIAGTGGGIVASGADATPTADGTNGGGLAGLAATTDYRLAAIHVDEADNQSAIVTSDTFTTDAAGAGIGTPVRLLSTPYSDSAEATASHTTAEVTPTGGAPVVIVVHQVVGGTTSLQIPTAASFGGVSVTPHETLAQRSRLHTFIYVVDNPGSNAQSFSITFPNVPRGLVIEILEIPGATTVSPTGNAMTPVGDVGTGGTISGTTGANGSLVLYACTRRYSTETIAASGVAGTLSQQTSGQTSRFRDLASVIAWETVPTAGAAEATFSWPTSDDHTLVGLEIRNA